MPHAPDAIKFEDSAALSVKYPDDVRPWEEMWQVVKYAFDALERRYTSDDNPFDFGLLTNDALIFFLSCHHLGDHLWSDPQVELEKAEVRARIAATKDFSSSRTCPIASNTTLAGTRRCASCASLATTRTREPCGSGGL